MEQGDKMKILAIIGLMLCLTGCIFNINRSGIHFGKITLKYKSIAVIDYRAVCECGLYLSWSKPLVYDDNRRINDIVRFLVDKNGIHYIAYD
jgi:hypothetical protein